VQSFTADDYIRGILSKDRILLSKAITLIESARPADRQIAEHILRECVRAGKTSRRIAVTGSPGAGKSTLLNAFGKVLLENEKSFAILAIDPSSAVSKGSILGDKTRMEDIVNSDAAYIRPTASNTYLGGVAGSTRESMLLCEAFGFDYIFVETVGVGQSETMVKNMTDLFILLLLPNAGDELQGIKRGIMEMADILIIHKSDKDNYAAAKTAGAQVKQSLQFFTGQRTWMPRVLNISSKEKTGLQELKDTIESFYLQQETTGNLERLRNSQQVKWMEALAIEQLKNCLEHDETIAAYKSELRQKLLANEMDASEAANLLARKILNR
jgi:LAO/AO transport system kinase